MTDNFASARPSTGSDVARVAGVSKSAVSRAFTGGVVSEDSRKRIFAAARSLKYRPSMTARSLTTSRSNLIGVAITHLDNQFYPEVVERLSERLSVAGYRLVLFVTRGDTDLEPVLDELLGYRLDGVILASSSMAARVAVECQEARVPVVMFNNVDPDGVAPGVSADNIDGAHTVAAYLLAAGHQRFGVITGLTESTTSVERFAAFREAIAAAGCALPDVEVGGYSFDGAVRATENLLRGGDAPDAIFCVNDHMALAAMQTARTMGREPGRDVSIVGFDNVAISGWPAFALTTYAQPLAEMVEQTVLRLLDATAGRAVPTETVRMRGRLIVRRSARLAPGIVREPDGMAVWRAKSA